MITLRKTLIVILLPFMFVACAHHNDVRPGEDGIHRVILQTENDSPSNSRNAITQANHFCKQAKKIAVITKEKVTYRGDMDEKTYKNSKKIAETVRDVGSAVWIFGNDGSRGSKAGRTATIGGHTADSLLGAQYILEVFFKCQNI